ncbi:MAG: alpha/beta hydrolase [Desulfobulbaceae bacterium]|nr:MAG: alpha/beta hydrolase [Desulfobulbaceae bacterium]
MAMSAALGGIILLIAVVYGALLLFVFIYQPRLLFLPGLGGRNVDRTPAQVNLAFEEVYLTSADNVRLDSWFVPAADADGVVLFCHGNAGNISHRLDSLALFHDLGLSVLIFDYRGYGRSQGHPSEAGTYADAEAAWHYLVTERHIAPQRIILFGRSLGAAVAARLATNRRPAALIVESAFTSVPDMAAELYPWLPTRLLSRLHYNTLAAVRQISCPLLVIHSRQDEIIPFQHGEAIFAAADTTKDFLEIKGGHNDGFLLSDSIYRQGLADFLDRHLPGSAPEGNRQ